MSFGACHVGLIDYEAGNVRSIENALDHLGARVSLVSEASDFEGKTHLLLPGVGAFGYCADKLRATGLVPQLKQWAIDDGRPLLGICVGMQLLADRGEELGVHEGLGFVGGTVRPLEGDPPRVRIPHVGWNDVTFADDFGSFRAGDKADFYFDHSFAYHDPVHGETLGTAEHGQRFCAIVRRGKLVASQFHPEKSQRAGLRFLEGFLRIDPC